VAVEKVPFPAPLTVNTPFENVPLPAKPTEPMSPSDQLEGSGVTVNVALFALCPPTVTENVPEDAPDGTSTSISVLVQPVGVALVPLSETVLPP